MAQITVKDFALEIDTDARTARKFLRAVTPREDHPGKGSRWAIEKKQIRSLKSKFTKWENEQKEKAAIRAENAKKKAEKAEKNAADENAEIILDENGDAEPTAEELADLEIEMNGSDEDF